MSPPLVTPPSCRTIASDGPASLPLPARRQICAHNGLRGIAALLVVAYHQQFGPFYKLPFELSTNFFRRSYLMVDLFFVLSGFIISYVYRAEPTGLRVPVKSFLFARFARIYPLHFVISIYMLLFAFGSSALLAAAGHSYSMPGSRELIEWLLQVALLQAWTPHFVGWNIPSWSISAEMFAYLLFPAIVLLARKSAKIAKAVLLATSIAFYGYIFATTGSLDITAGLAPLRCLAGFGLGMLLYDYRDFEAHASDGLLSALQIVAVLWAAWALLYKVDDPLIIPSFGLLVAATWNDRALVSKFLSHRLFEWLGNISYSVYLLHVPIGVTLWFFWARLAQRLNLAPPESRIMWLALIFSTVLVGATLSYRYIEVPARRMLMRWWGAPRSLRTSALVGAP